MVSLWSGVPQRKWCIKAMYRHCIVVNLALTAFSTTFICKALFRDGMCGPQCACDVWDFGGVFLCPGRGGSGFGGLVDKGMADVAASDISPSLLLYILLVVSLDG